MRSIFTGLSLGLLVFAMSHFAHAACTDTCAWNRV